MSYNKQLAFLFFHNVAETSFHTDEKKHIYIYKFYVVILIDRLH